MTVREIVAQHLKQHGATALISGSCACSIDDLFPCNYCDPTECQGAYCYTCKGCGAKQAFLEKLRTWTCEKCGLENFTKEG